MYQLLITLTLYQLRKRVHGLNQKLIGEQLFVCETGTEHCVIALINTESQQVIATFGINTLANRDVCLISAFMKLIEHTRVPHQYVFEA